MIFFCSTPEHSSVIVSSVVRIKVGVNVVIRSQPFESSCSVTITRSVTVSVRLTSISAPDSSSQSRSQCRLSKAVGRKMGTPILPVALVVLVGKVGSSLIDGSVSFIRDVVALINEGWEGKISPGDEIVMGDGKEEEDR